jgi:hypothetical protein
MLRQSNKLKNHRQCLLTSSLRTERHWTQDLCDFVRNTLNTTLKERGCLDKVFAFNMIIIEVTLVYNYLVTQWEELGQAIFEEGLLSGSVSSENKTYKKGRNQTHKRKHNGNRSKKFPKDFKVAHGFIKIHKKYNEILPN